MTRHLVCLTFDFDAVSGWIARGMTSPTPMSRGEFGSVAAPRILSLLAKYTIRSTWFIPGHTIESFPNEAEAVVAAGHEIAHHGWTHRPPASVNREEEEREIVRGNDAIMRLSGRRARGYRSPSWDLSAHTIEILERNGFLYDSSMMGNDYTPYIARKGDVVELEKPFKRGAESKIVELPISWTLDDYPHFEFLRTPNFVLPGLMSANNVLHNWSDDFLYMTRIMEWGVITYTCHPFVIGRGHRMLMLERLILGLIERGAVFATMEDALAEWLALPKREAGR
ncbi:MAG TPA: polysaccharide deacetylase [Alphaproteobacteria bacterium]|nr:polysaccharide deacetylase [Alphaproteobacteria bacterium]